MFLAKRGGVCKKWFFPTFPMDHKNWYHLAVLLILVLDSKERVRLDSTLVPKNGAKLEHSRNAMICKRNMVNSMFRLHVA